MLKLLILFEFGPYVEQENLQIFLHKNDSAQSSYARMMMDVRRVFYCMKPEDSVKPLAKF